MKIWIDADSCPKAVRDIVQKAAERLDIFAHFVANKPIAGLDGNNIYVHRCPQGQDVADNFIVDYAAAGDIAITRDVPLASRLVEKSIHVLDDRGQNYTSDNIQEKLSLRNFSLGLALNGLGGPRVATMGPRDLKAFADSFDRLLAKLLKT